MDDELLFTEERDSLLVAGTYIYTVVITDLSTGCTAIAGPMNVIVHDLPEVEIQASNQPPFCEFVEITFTILNPDPTLDYRWNTGETTLSISTERPGNYYAIATNQFGCEKESNIMEILAAPIVANIPSGCYRRCRPDTICLPENTDIISYQWYLDGNLIPAPEGTIANFIAFESGNYQVELVDINGCENTSDILSLDLYDGIGTITGIVAFDLNGNNIYDAGDTLVNNVQISLLQDGSEINSTITQNGNGFVFQDILATLYEIELDTLTIPPGTQIIQHIENAALFGCDRTVNILFLLEELCQPSFGNAQFSACEGSNIIFENEVIEAGQTTEVFLVNSLGCDSIITVEVAILTKDSSDLELMVCEEQFIMYNGMELAGGESVEVILSNQNQCDSSVFVTVQTLLPDFEDLNLTACEGATALYMGTEIAAGDQMDFLFENENGCDSTVTVMVETLQLDAEMLSFESCQGSSITYNGMQIPAGSQEDFLFQNMAGCDSMVTVVVAVTEVDTIPLTLPVCENEIIDYQGVMLGDGDVMIFSFSDINGCDSMVQVMVEALPPDTEMLSFESCQGSSITYNGVQIPAGSQEDFIFQNLAGCDSMVTVVVALTEVDTIPLILPVCENEMIDYQGVILGDGDVMIFSFSDINGCDSIVEVAVNAESIEADDLTFFVCENETVMYDGEVLPAGIEQDFILESENGCDSIVTVTTVGLELSETEINLSACENETVNFNGFDLLAGSQSEFILTNQSSCDSVITVNVATLFPTSAELNLMVCQGETIDFQGTELEAGAAETFILENHDGCDSTVAVLVSNFETIEFGIESQESCPNSANGSIQFVDIQTVDPNLSFSIDGSNYQNDPLFLNLESGTYPVFLLDDNGCLFEEETTIELLPELVVDLANFPLPCSQPFIELAPEIEENGVGDLSFEWSTGSIERSIQVAEPGNYWVDITSDCETKRVETTISLADDGRNEFLFIPNVFSPNGDQINDELQGVFAEGTEVLSFEWHLFDRWGQSTFCNPIH